MLLSQAIKLIAAYDHRHIFIDPDPDPLRSWEERSRLFNLPRSSWDDYDKSLISTGGGVFPRTQKSIPLTPQILEALGRDDETNDPASRISAILNAPADLIWFAAIGTAVQEEYETNAGIREHGNDNVRPNTRHNQ